MEKVELPQSRDIGQTIGDPFLFVRHNIGFLFRGFLYYGVPPLIVAVTCLAFGFAGLLGRYQQVFNNTGGFNTFGNRDGFANLGISVIVAYVLFIIIFISQQVYVTTYMVLKENNDEVNNADVMGRMKSDWKNIVVTFLFLILFAFLVGLLIGGVIFSAKALGTGIAIFLGISLAIFLAYAWVPLSNLLFVRLREKLGIFVAVAQTFRITYGKWWKTFIASFVVSIVFQSMLYLLLIPFYIVVGTIAYHAASAGVTPSVSSMYLNPVSEVVLTLTTFFAFFLQNIFTVFTGINYFSLSEKYSNFHLIAQIEKIGDREDKNTRRQEGEF